ncbi:MAG: acyl carrier protein phosphodiesterase [Haloplasmataceae bacterium]|jgi:FMN-dependent NADH-azoreductase|nr:acyl carrier protein phosphodiesterase [Haloplasmataceae bacterium]
MAKVLYIKANPKKDEESTTFKLANVFLNEYKAKNPNDEIIVLDLYKENIRPLDETLLQEMFSKKDGEILRQAKLFASCDKFIVAAPMWNLSFPSILKVYFDYITQVGIVFKYTESGSVGLLADRPRKAIHIVSRGGLYSEGPAKEYEQGDRYIRTLFNFFGIMDIQTLAIELTNVLPKEQLEVESQKVYAKAKDIAKSF